MRWKNGFGCRRIVRWLRLCGKELHLFPGSTHSSSRMMAAGIGLHPRWDGHSEHDLGPFGTIQESNKLSIQHEGHVYGAGSPTMIARQCRIDSLLAGTIRPERKRRLGGGRPDQRFGCHRKRRWLWTMSEAWTPTRGYHKHLQDWRVVGFGFGRLGIAE